MKTTLSRRQWVVQAGACLGAGMAGGLSATCTGAASASAVSACATGPSPQQASARPGAAPFRFCLNTGTLMGFRLSLAEQVEIAAKAGYEGIEPWVRDIRRYVDEGGSLDEMRRRLADLGLTVESAIGFPAWAVDDDQRRAQALEQLKEEMELVRRLGGRRIAAPPAGINRTPGVDLFKVAQRYRAVLELGRRLEVVPQLEIWGSARTLSTPGEAALVAMQADHPDACLLLDVFHVYKGTGGFEGLRLLNGAAMHIWHINDYPAQPPRAEITDAHRVYPGDGVAPLGMILRVLYQTGFRGALSLELFNRIYWQQGDPLVVARTGLQKSRDAVAQAMAND